MATTGTAQCPTCSAALAVRGGRWRCVCGTSGTVLPDGIGGHRLAVLAAPRTLAGVRGRFGVQLLEDRPSTYTGGG